MGICISSSASSNDVNKSRSKITLRLKYFCCKKEPIISDLTTTCQDKMTASCSICLDSFNTLQKKHSTLVIQPCGHVLCKKCFKGWINKNSKKTTCPICRHEFEIINVFYSKSLFCNKEFRDNTVSTKCKHQLSILLLHKDNILVMCNECHNNYTKCCHKYQIKRICV